MLPLRTWLDDGYSACYTTCVLCAECDRPIGDPEDYLCLTCGADKRGTVLDGFNAMGRPIPVERIQAARRFMREITGLPYPGTVRVIADHLRADDPESAMRCARRMLDLTGAYRLFAILLASPVEDS
jgi:hypothetical protein